jgi:outer membrane cobalamin receptor
MKRISLLLTLILLIINAHAEGTANSDKGGVVKGFVIDQHTQQPIEYATIAIHNISGALVTGTVSDMTGEFKINGLTDGTYYAIITFLGYENQKIESIELSASHRVIDLGQIKLKPSSTELQAVEVVAEKKAFEYKIDKKVINVSKMPTAASMTAVEVLQNVPSVKVDIEGNVSLRGSTGFTVLIDGKPSILESSDALRQIPASSIENIEIITNPSAKYQPDGTAGIINVITKKNKMQGVNGQANINAGRFGTYGGDFLINKRQKSVNFYLGADYNNRVFKAENEGERLSLSNNKLDTMLLNSDGTSKRAFTMWSARTGIEVDIDEKNSATLGFRLGSRDMTNRANNDFTQYTSYNNLTDNYLSKESWNRSGMFYSITGTFLHQFDKKGHDIRAQVDMSSRGGEESSQEDLYRDVLVQSRRNNENGPAKRLELKLDYTHPFSETNKMELGYQGRLEQEDDETAMDTLNTANGNWINESAYNNKSEGDQNIQALYATYSGMMGKLGYQAGLRGEYTYRTIVTNNQDFTLDRFDYFPTLHLSYSLPADNQLMASYSRRVERTRGWYLEPFVTWTDAYNVRQGNPGLVPEFIDSYEMGYNKQFEKSFISLEGYYRVTHNKLEQIQRKWENDNTGKVMMTQPFNVGSDYSLGVEASVNLKQIKWWEINLMGNMYQYKIEGAFAGTDFSNSTFNWGARWNNTFIPAKNMQITFNGNFNSASATAQGKTEGYYTFDLAYRIDMMQRKLAAVLQVRDIFATAERESTTSGPNFNNYSYSHNLAPMVSMTVTYRFNNYNPKRPSRNGGEESNGGGEDF